MWVCSSSQWSVEPHPLPSPSPIAFSSVTRSAVNVSFSAPSSDQADCAVGFAVATLSLLSQGEGKFTVGANAANDYAEYTTRTQYYGVVGADTAGFPLYSLLTKPELYNLHINNTKGRTTGDLSNMWFILSTLQDAE